MPFLYILTNEKGNYYIGSTINLDKRIIQHKNGTTKTTKRLQTFKLIFKQEYDNIGKARNIEYKLKKLKRRDYIEKIIQQGFIKMKPSMRG